jgi:hypothetical protein
MKFWTIRNSFILLYLLGNALTYRHLVKLDPSHALPLPMRTYLPADVSKYCIGWSRYTPIITFAVNMATTSPKQASLKLKKLFFRPHAIVALMVLVVLILILNTMFR